MRLFKPSAALLPLYLIHARGGSGLSARAVLSIRRALTARTSALCLNADHDEPRSGLTPSNTLAETIFALSSGGGRAGVSVIRISGPQAREVLLQMAPGRQGAAELPPPRQAVLRRLRQPSEHGGGCGDRGGEGPPAELIDQALVLWFPGPRSFTGEDVVELHTHGSRAVVAATLGALNSIRGLRLAEPGEFTRQAFSNGRMSLTEVEGLGDLINSDTEEQRKQALAQMEGVQRRVFEGWRETLLGSLAHTEALIDFGEDADDVTEAALSGAVSRVRSLRAEMAARLRDGERGEAVRDGVRLAILGPPNAGKSSLLNALAARDAAIVSPTAGTTRDVVSLTLELGGLPVVVSDTAGLRAETADEIERQGMARAAKEAARAHLQLWVYDALAPPQSAEQLEAALASARAGAEQEPQQAEPQKLLLLNKVDLLPEGTASASAFFAADRQWGVSCLTGEGVQDFLTSLAEIVKRQYGADEREPALVTRARHVQHLTACVKALDAFVELAQLGDGAPLDIATEELRTAVNELGKITGRVDVEELLDVIFRDFCIGK